MIQRTWWIITGIYVFKNERKPRIMLSDDTKSTMIPNIFPTKEEAEEHAKYFYKEKYWKSVKVVEIKLVPIGE